MIEALARAGVDLGGPTLVAYAVVALVAGLLGVALGSFLELLRTWRLARRAIRHELEAVSYNEPAVAFAGPAYAYEGPSEPGLEDWFTGSGLAVRRRGRGRQVAVLVALAVLVIVATFGVAAALLGVVPTQLLGWF